MVIGNTGLSILRKQKYIKKLLSQDTFFLASVNLKRLGVLQFFLVKNDNFKLALVLILRLNLSFFNRGV